MFVGCAVKNALTGTINISRPSCSDGRDVIRITVADDGSRAEFLELEMNVAEFGLAVTGLSFRPVKFVTRGLSVVGKKRMTQPFLHVVSEAELEECGISPYDRKQMEAYAKTITPPEGWTLDTYLGSQTSIQWDSQAKTYSLHMRIETFVEITE